MASDPRIRASDADRDRTAALLREHLAAGRLTAEEFNERLDKAYAAKTLGDLDQNSAKFSLADRQVPIRVSLIEGSRKNLSTLENLPVPTTGGGAVPLKAVADISFGEGPTRIRRYNQSRRLSIEADLTPGVEFGTAMSETVLITDSGNEVLTGTPRELVTV